MTIKDLEIEIATLSDPEKKLLLRRLIADLDQGTDEDAEHIWLEEAQNRYRELMEGEVKTVSAEDAIKEARDRLENVRGTTS